MDNTLHTRSVKSVLFGVLSPQKIVEQAVCEIDKYISNIRETSKDANTVMDGAMGTITKDAICPTCLNTYADCPGHFGYIKLALPIYNILFLNIILKILKCTCAHCGRLLPTIDEHTITSISPKNRLNYLVLITHSSNPCKYCNGLQPKFTMYKKDYISINMQSREIVAGENGRETTRFSSEIKRLSALDVWRFLVKIPDEQCVYYGLSPEYSRPEWMIWMYMPVPPLHTRMILGIAFSNKPSIDDLTIALNTNIVKANTELNKLLDSLRHPGEGKPALTEEEILANEDVQRKWDVLQICVNQYINNESMLTKMKQKNGRLLKSISERLKTKKGLVRNNLEGKRVNESARSVITCDPDLDIDQVGVPRKIATGLTYPEHVNKYNIGRLRTLVKNGPFAYPGAKSVKRKNGKMYALVTQEQCDQIANTLEIGDTVNRNLLDNDLVMLNRQPTLHRMNIMAHRVKVLDYDTFRINPNVTTPYNADFDGDEMNIFCITNYMQLAELKYMMHVSTQFISPQINSPIIGTVQDSTLAPYLITSLDELSPSMFQQLLGAAYLNNFDQLNLNRDLSKLMDDDRRLQFTPRTLMSMIFPEHYAYKSSNIEIINGIVQAMEQIDKRNLVAGNYNTFFHQSFNTLGAMMTNQLFNSFARLANEFFILNGFTSGIRDCFPPNDEFFAKIDREVLTYIHKVNSLLYLISDVPKKDQIQFINEIESEEERTQFRSLLNMSTREIWESFPLFVKNMWGKYSQTVDSLVFETYNSVKANDGLSLMIRSGSKGSKKNLTSIIGLLGQQDVDGHWILEELNHRTLPHFPKDTNDPYAHGFITHNYFNGLDPIEYYFQAIAGRFTQMLKSIKTADTGYFQRCFIKMFENVFSAHDNSIRNSFGSVIQYLYGGDGFNVYNLMRIDISDLEFWRSIDEFDQSLQEEILFDDERKLLRTLYLIMHSYFVRNRTIPRHMMLPLNVSQIIENTINSNKQLTTLTDPMDEPDARAHCWNTVRAFVNNISKNIYSDYTMYTKLVLIVFSVVYYCRSHAMWKNSTYISLIIAEIERIIRMSLIKPTENIGIIMAQSIGQPTTQMSLNAFHNSGRSTAVTGGVPRLKELVRLSSKIATPSMTIKVRSNTLLPHDEGHKVNLARANFIKANISEITLERILSRKSVQFFQTLANIPNSSIADTLSEVLKGEDNKTAKSTNLFYVQLEFDKFSLLYNNTFILDIDIAINQAIATDSTINASTNWMYGSAETGTDPDTLYYGIFFQVNVGNFEDQVLTTFGVLSWINMSFLEKLLRTQIYGFEGITRSELIEGSNEPVILETTNNKVSTTTLCSVTANPDRYKQLVDEHDYTSYTILTTGTNLLLVLSMLKNVNRHETITNDVMEIFRLMGVEAARSAMMHEINIVMNSDDNSVIDHRHLQLLVDVMTHPGFLISMDRHGMIKSTSAPLQRASFEETTKQIVTAAVFNESDPMNSISDNIMFGQIIPTGTASAGLRLNIQRFNQLWHDEVTAPQPVKELARAFDLSFKIMLNPNL